MRNITNALGATGESLLWNKLVKIKYLLGLMLCVLGTGLTASAAPSDLDPTFGGTGRVVSSPDGSQQLLGLAMALQPDGKIIMAGTRFVNSTYSGFVVARYNSNGTLDTDFGSGGWNSVTFGAGYEYAPSVDVQPDGKIVVAGTIRNIVNNQPFNDIAVVRFNPDGSVDTNFDGDGKLIVDFNTNLGSVYQEYLSVIKVAGDGKLVVAGVALNSGVNDRFILARINSDGSLDTSFGTNGKFADELSGSNHDRLTDMIVLPDGKIVVTGTYINVLGNFRLVVKYNVNGSREWAYQQGTVGAPNAGHGFNGIAALPDGKFIAVGKRSNQIVATRLNANGTEDTSFSNPTMPNGEAFSVAIQPDGKIVTNLFVTGNSSFSLLRYNADGSADTSFGSGGLINTAVTNSQDYGKKVLIQSDGKILVGGYSVLNSPTRYYFSIVRYKGESSASDNPLFDYDGDGKADLSVFRPSTGFWYIVRPIGVPSSQNFDAVQFGANGDLTVPADYDGDGKTDIAVWRPADGTWYLRQSTLGFRAAQFGSNGDIPVPGDFDGDGKANLAVFRPSTGAWYIARATGTPSQNFDAVPFGVNGDKPVAGADFDGDGKADVAVFRPSEGKWYRLNSSNNQFVSVHFGIFEDKPVAADYDGDGKTDLAVWRPSDGSWYRINSQTDTFSATQFGVSADRPAPADYDGDGKADLAVFRPSDGNWYLLRSTQGFAGVEFGTNGDIPAPGSFVR